MKVRNANDQREWFENRFTSELSWRDGTVDGVPSWYSQLLTDLILATGDDAILYFSAKYVAPRGPNPGSVAVVAFTDDIVAYANFDGDPGTGATPLEVIVTARRMLSSFGLESDALDTDAAANPLAAVRITVNYPQFSRTLPLGASDWTDRDSETADLIACLRRDLVA
ncbi:MAG: hypothetical protein H7226_12510 [Salinibacterium sp.]|nr:hypothetical protein [Salinibacterium sp.]